MTYHTLNVRFPAQAYTLTAAAGAFSLSGKTAGLTFEGESDFAWVISDNATQNTGANQSLTLATGVTTETYYVSPDLLPGQTLEESGGVLSLVGDSTVPTVNGDDPGSPIDEISARDIVIEVMDNPIATIRNATQDITYEYAATGSWPSHDGQATNRWNWVIGQANAGDVIEISPGAAQAVIADAANYHSNSIDSCGLAVLKPLTIKNMDGRGRWRVWPADVASLESNRNAIGVFDRLGMYDTTRTDIVLEGFDLTDQFLSGASGVRLRSPVAVEGSWASDHASVTLRNFKIGRTSGTSLSGVSGGGAEVLTLEDGHIFDCGNGSGQEHNAYISSKVMNLLGMRMSRTRGHSSTPPDSGNWDGSVVLEGHILKASAVTGLIEGCAFDMALLGDQSHLVQMKAGGNWTLRGNLFIDSKYPMTSRGMLNMTREFGGAVGADASGATTDGSSYSVGATTIGLAAAGTGRILRGALLSFEGDSTTRYMVTSASIANIASGGSIDIWPALVNSLSSGAKAVTLTNNENFEWWAGAEGNSLTVERNVFVGRYPRAVIYMFDWAGTSQYPGGSPFALFPSGASVPFDEMKMDSMTVQDNIAMITDVAANHMLSGFPSTNNAYWIRFDPTSGTYWTARGNSIETYTDEPWTAFSNRKLLLFTRAAGTIAASGSLATKRFIWPHGYIDRTDSFRGLA